ncbi:mediator of RNA polymerase II transcription subunit 21-like [Argiope bruennichi]|uniref:Mediator of RNA polymerase II transcription subunit 21 n=1 Tax=Argiope bruennichi TaxID=94029 RepID=A0A8T0EVX1_ARGBR|nr:mediator of RNA polymerase II transcription subunit 21-like [Argiope bruennichi]KAF8781884.1 Mediator of RNA polymerase II transcription like protein [Argiope bruennichi]
MADRLTQLQDAVNAQAENICNSIGVLQQCATPSIFPEFDRVGPKPPPPPEDYCQIFANLICKTAKDIDVLIDSLPSEESYPELQEASIKNLNAENIEAARALEELVVKGECLLEQIRKVLSDIAQSEQEMQKISNFPEK